ncbi:MAG: DUF460 domain-containing protein, partial [archaeon]
MTGSEQQLIVGIDPGTTTAYAILDIDGNTIALRSSKELSLDTIIKEVSQKGIPLIVGTDRRKCPQMVSKFSAKTGAAKAIPSYDVSEIEKNSITRGMNAANSHQKDALAAALLAYKQYEPLLKRIVKTLGKESKMELAEEVASIVISRKISIKKALATIQ